MEGDLLGRERRQGRIKVFVLYILILRDELKINLCQGGIQADLRIRSGTEAAA